MAHFSPVVLRRYLLGGTLPGRGCLRPLRHRQTTPPLYSRNFHSAQVEKTSFERTEIDNAADLPVSFRKELKDKAKQRKVQEKERKAKKDNQSLDKWELTVGIEIHAQLNTARKLFSSAASTINETPNSHVAFFDLAMPGSQPAFQKETLIPAIRAALALNCDINRTSRFDRKHYFHWDQPSGYQITQYYEPFATNGYITLFAHDGIAKEDGDHIRIGIKQIQMEQDTAKTMSQPGDIHLLDFNRVGLPLIEVITLPHIHYPATAAALVRKIQIMLGSVDACVLGLQSGGLRADVNVSVRQRNTEGSHSYSGVSGLGQRTEIKNLSSFKAIEDAIIAERDRQISVLEAGGVIEGETRGWTIGSTETRRLRGKEGEVDYRYMPDADLAPVVIGEDLISRLRDTMGVLPHEEISFLVTQYGLTSKDALSISSLNNGGRVEYFYGVVEAYLALEPSESLVHAGKFCANWVLHEMGGLTHRNADEDNPLQFTDEGSCLIPASHLAQLLHFLHQNRITGKSAKDVLADLFNSSLKLDPTSSEQIPTPEFVITSKNLWYHPLSDKEYEDLAKSVFDTEVVDEILAGKKGKANFLVGQMMRTASEDENLKGRVDVVRATEVLWGLIEEKRVQRNQKNRDDVVRATDSLWGWIGKLGGKGKGE